MTRRMANHLPDKWEFELRRIHYRRQIRKGIFVTSEPEYAMLTQYVKNGDWVIDIGANVGHYTKKLSDLVGKSGRVIAFEPVPKTFSLLSCNIQMCSHKNVTLLNSAVSDKSEIVGITIPNSSNGYSNYYQAHVSKINDGNLNVLTIAIDSLCINNKISLIKVDAEGHEKFIIDGMRILLQKYHPTLIIETDNPLIESSLSQLGYTYERLPNSPNLLFSTYS